MKLFKILIIIFIFCGIINVKAQTKNSQSEITQIEETLMNYIEGTANGEPNKLKKAFNPDFNIYTISNDSLRICSGKKYVDNVKEGGKSNRIGRIISIDYENDAAVAKQKL